MEDPPRTRNSSSLSETIECFPFSPGCSALCDAAFEVHLRIAVSGEIGREVSDASGQQISCPLSVFLRTEPRLPLPLAGSDTSEEVSSMALLVVDRCDLRLGLRS